jgi:hypothetical protein
VTTGAQAVLEPLSNPNVRSPAQARCRLASSRRPDGWSTGSDAPKSAAHVTMTPLVQLIAAGRHGVLATIKPSGHPYMSNVLYVWDEENQIARISTTARRLKARNLRRDPPTRPCTSEASTSGISPSPKAPPNSPDTIPLGSSPLHSPGHFRISARAHRHRSCPRMTESLSTISHHGAP